MTQFIWKKDYQLGNPEIDLQHQQLFELANQLLQSINQQKLTENAMRLYRHVRIHFDAEEAFMKNCKYPDYEQHVAMHNLMIDKLVEISDKISRNEWRQDDIQEFMKEWINHVLEHDCNIRDHILIQQY